MLALNNSMSPTDKGPASSNYTNTYVNLFKNFCKKKIDIRNGSHKTELTNACENSITYGFEVHVGGESSRIPFKFLMNRKVDWQNLEGFIYDNCCNLFQGQKKLKKRDERTGSDGHLGCSESYNFMEYKKFTSIHKDGKKTARKGSRCTVFSSHWQNPLDR